MNAYREVRGRSALTHSPGVEFLRYGKANEGYWNYEKFEVQVIDYLDVFDALHPDWQLLLEVDWSSGHAKHSAGALDVNSMNVSYGGAQRTPRDSTIPDDADEAAMYLGPYPAVIKHNGKVAAAPPPRARERQSPRAYLAPFAQEIDCKLKPGDTHHFYFREDDPPPFYELDAPRVDTETGKRNRTGKAVVKEGYVEKPKGAPRAPIALTKLIMKCSCINSTLAHVSPLGMKQAAFERGLHKPPSADGKHKMNGKKFDEDDANQDPSYSLPHVLSNCWDFATERTALQELVESRGHILIMSAKGHPELAGVGVEYTWGKAKQMFRRHVNDRIAKHLRRNIIACFRRAADFLPLSRIYKFARKARAYRRAYRDNEPNSFADVEKLMKRYKCHRNAATFDTAFIEHS